MPAEQTGRDEKENCGACAALYLLAKLLFYLQASQTNAVIFRASFLTFILFNELGLKEDCE